MSEASQPARKGRKPKEAAVPPPVSEPNPDPVPKKDPELSFDIDKFLWYAARIAASLQLPYEAGHYARHMVRDTLLRDGKPITDEEASKLIQGKIQR